MKFRSLLLLSLVFCAVPDVAAQTGSYDGLDNNLNNLYRLSDAKTRSISPENLSGEKGKGGMAKVGNASEAARDLGQGWKVNPFVIIEPKTTFTLGEIDGAGAIQHIWMTPTGNWRFSILRIYWDGETEASVEAPVGDFFAMGWGRYAQLTSLAVCVNPGSAFNSYWVMPFRKHAKASISAPTWRGASTAMAGGAKARSSFIWTAIRNSRPSTAPARKIISAARTISRILRSASIKSSRRPIRD
jgi:hypothetical protein